jgi:hydrogenase-1 operon protein HyaF
MAIRIDIPVVGAGSQPPEEDGAFLGVMSMPREMNTYSMPVLPAPEEIAALTEARRVLASVRERLADYRIEQPPTVFDISGLDDTNRRLIDQLMGEGEVSIVFDDTTPTHIQESVLAGVWRVRYLDENRGVRKDTIEIAAIPHLVTTATFAESRPRVELGDGAPPAGVQNALPVITEINDKIDGYPRDREPHIVNLTLLPQTEEDLAFLGQRLGRGKVTILSRGYGNCRITSTATRDVWWVQYFNSQDVNILNTLEVSRVPAVACASQEDIEDSAARLREILEAYA